MSRTLPDPSWLLVTIHQFFRMRYHIAACHAGRLQVTFPHLQFAAHRVFPPASPRDCPPSLHNTRRELIGCPFVRRQPVVHHDRSGSAGLLWHRLTALTSRVTSRPRNRPASDFPTAYGVYRVTPMEGQLSLITDRYLKIKVDAPHTGT